MYLHEEYVKRNNLDNATLIKHYSNINEPFTALFRKRSNQREWLILKAQWKLNNHHPGFYVVKQHHPVYGSYNSSLRPNSYFNRICEDKNVDFDAWESFWYEFIVYNKEYELIYDKNEIFNAAWEITLFVSDEFLSIQSDNIQSSIYKTLDNSSYKNLNIDKCIKEISIVNRHFLDLWCHIQNYVTQKHCAWLGEWQKKILSGCEKKIK